ncbi:MAG: protein phosphatase 2C domain-containing protein [Myxococcota bacterium]|nr:protein phosphatase 2C domain-containing protein [Myxococcota bacterium]
MNTPENKTGSAKTVPSGKEITVHVFGRTDVGLVREHNEDNFLVADLTAGNRSIKPEVQEHVVGPKGSLFTVCDGMGGAAAGEVASKIGVDTIYDMMQAEPLPETDEDLACRLEAAITEAGLRIFKAAKEDRRQRGMGTTVTAAVMTGPRLIIGQVGDSRAYILRGENLVQVTKDQSLVQQLIDAKQLTVEEAKHFDKTNIILQALGTAEEIHVDMTSVVLRRGDILVMCSDGLSGLVSEDIMTRVIQDISDPTEVCRTLTDLACHAGGHDNITVIIARFGGDGLLVSKDTDDLSYRQYRYSTSSEITLRSPNPLGIGAQGVDIQEKSPPPSQVPGTAPKEIPRPPPVPSRHASPNKAQHAPPVASDSQADSRSFGALSGIAAVLLVAVAVAAYTLSSGSEPAMPDQDSQQIAPEEVVRPIQPNTAVISAPTDADLLPLDPDEPVLGPTPEEAFLGTGLDSDTGMQHRQGRKKKPRKKPHIVVGETISADPSSPEIPGEQDVTTQSATEPVDPSEEEKDTPAADPQTSATTPEAGSEVDREDTEAATPVIIPRPLDENPF